MAQAPSLTITKNIVFRLTSRMLTATSRKLQKKKTMTTQKSIIASPGGKFYAINMKKRVETRKM